MTLEDKLNDIRQGAKERIPQEVRDIMQRATKELRESGIMEKVLNVGENLPSFELPAPAGQMISSEELLKQGSLVLTFYRGVWWPYCNAELEALQGVENDIRAFGARLIAVCPQRPEFLKQMREKHSLKFEILRDEGNVYAEKLGLRHTLPDYLQEAYMKFPIDLPRINGEPSWTLPMPARYVVKQDGIIAAADFDPDYTVRPEPQKTLADLKKIV